MDALTDILNVCYDASHRLRINFYNLLKKNKDSNMIKIGSNGKLI